MYIEIQRKCRVFTEQLLSLIRGSDTTLDGSTRHILLNIKTCFFVPTTEEEIMEVLHLLNSKSSPGHDTLSVEDIIILDATITAVLVTLINNMLSTGEFPEPLKVSKIVSIHKKKQKTGDR